MDNKVFENEFQCPWCYKTQSIYPTIGSQKMVEVIQGCGNCSRKVVLILSPITRKRLYITVQKQKTTRLFGPSVSFS